MDTDSEKDAEIAITSLNHRVKTMEAKCAVLDEVMEENFLLKERLESAEASKDALMRLVWQHLETINKI